MRLLIKCVLSVFLGLLIACESKTINNFDCKSWKNDENGCKGQRKQLVDSLLNRKNELLGFTEVEILKTLGKPDMNDLRRRQQKYYYYYVFNKQSCSKDSIDKIFKLKFNAIDQVQEVIYE